jgi:hypothetical protein
VRSTAAVVRLADRLEQTPWEIELMLQRGGGAIVNMSSGAGIKGFADSWEARGWGWSCCGS